MAKSILKDLNNYDGLKSEVAMLKYADSVQSKRIQGKDSTIALYDKQVAAYSQLAANLSIQKDVLVTQKNIAENNYEQQKKRTILSQIGGLCLFITAIFFK